MMYTVLFHWSTHQKNKKLSTQDKKRCGPSDEDFCRECRQILKLTKQQLNVYAHGITSNVLNY